MTLTDNEIRTEYGRLLGALGERSEDYRGIHDRLASVVMPLTARMPERRATVWAAGMVALTVEAYRLSCDPERIVTLAGVPADELAATVGDIRRELGLDIDPALVDQLLTTIWEHFLHDADFNPALRLKALQERILAANGAQDWPAALAAYEEMQQQFGNVPYAIIGRCRTLFNLQRYAEALGVLETAVGDGPLPPEIAELKAETLLELGRDDEALAIYQAALAVGGVEPHTRAGLVLGAASIFQFRGDSAAAEKLLIEAMADDPNHLELLERLMAVQRDNGRPDDALITGHRLLALDPTNPWRHFDLADLQIDQGLLTDAVRTLENGILQAGDLLEFHRRLMLVHRQTGDQEAAAREQHTILEARPVEPFDALVQAELLLANNRLDEAGQALGRAADAPSMANTARMLEGFHRVRVGEDREAVGIWRDLAANDAAALVGLFDRFRELWPDPESAPRLAALARRLGVESGDEIMLSVAAALGDSGDAAA